LYFSLIGCGFMLAEIALIQRLTVLLSHPIYALGILLFTLIASTGIGSALSDRLPLTRRPWIYLYPVVTAAALIALSSGLKVILATMITVPITTRILTSVAVIFPTGILLGLFFPAGMRLVRECDWSGTSLPMRRRGIGLSMESSACSARHWRCSFRFTSGSRLTSTLRRSVICA
jgi:hypothetical protein